MSLWKLEFLGTVTVEADNEDDAIDLVQDHIQQAALEQAPENVDVDFEFVGTPEEYEEEC